MTAKLIRKPNGTRVYAEISPAGVPQIFPYTSDDDQVLVLAAQNPADEALQEVAGSVMDHREGYSRGHTLNCRGDLRRGLCH